MALAYRLYRSTEFNIINAIDQLSFILHTCTHDIHTCHRRRSRGGRGGRVPPSNFSGGDRPPLDFWKLKKYLFIYLHFKHNESNTKRLIQHKNTTKHTKSLNLLRASRADSRPNHISASLALPAISVSPPPPPQIMFFSEFCRYIWKFVATCKPTSMSFVPTKYLKYQQNIERNSSFRI